MRSFSPSIWFFCTSLLILFLIINNPIHATNSGYAPVTIRTNLTLASGAWNADCTAKTGLMINGASPGPAITATQGDLVVVTVSNGHTQGVTVHFHGVTQKGTPFADGVPGLSQVAIPPGGTYEYRWRARNSGTYFYHAHTRFDASSVYGAIIIHDPKETLVYDDERVLLLNDYWHKDDDALYQGVMGSPMQWIGTPDAILLNGRTQGSGGPNVPSTDASTCGYSNISVSPGKTYRLRIVNAGGWSYLAVTIAGHAMTMVEADGHRTIPMPVNRIEIAPGQRYSVLLKADQAASSYWIRADPSWGPENSAKNGAALLTYEGSSPITSSPPPAVNMTAQEIPDWILPQVQSALTNPVMPEKADDTLTLTISPITQGSAIQKYAVNNVSYSDTASSSGKALLDMVYEDMQASRPAGSSISSNPSLITYPKDTVLDIIIQLDARSCLDAHPWHLHGHSYWDLGQGVGLYTAAEGAKAVPKSPLYRDTTMVFPQKDAGGANGCGWRRIRVKLDNPGIWPIHCHIHAHMIMGMMSVLGVGLDKLPARTPLPGGRGWVGELTDDAAMAKANGKNPGSGDADSTSSASFSAPSPLSLSMLALLVVLVTIHSLPL